ncbi:MAG: thioredoxin domain-containing protein [Deltaproteobacteria bacterium]|nr:thioredoxin domain-containing protein [Deltaproteobacteria bacterium]
MKNASVVIALVIGMVIGLLVGRMTAEGTAPSGTPTVAAAPAPSAAEAVRGAPAAPSDDPTYRIEVGDAHFKGPADALVTIIEFSDFECPFCSRVNPTIKQIQDTYGDKVRIAFKHNPLPFHKNAGPAANAVEAAGAQGKFWEMHDKLFANQKALTRPDLDGYAEEIGLDMGKFKAAMDGNAFQQKITAQQAEARRLGASGTPGFFINGKFLRGAQPFPRFKEVIDRELAAAEKLVATGVAKAQVYERTIARGLTKAAPPPQQAPNQRPARPQFGDVKVGDAHVKGPADAKVTIVEWSDFECPFCSRVVPTIKELTDSYGKDIRIAFKHQPLPFHKNAHLAAQAVEAAGAQGKFWEYHDKLFANQKALDRPQLEQYAGELGLDMAKFKASLDQGAFKKKIDAHSNEGRGVGANGTPTFFINGRLLSGAQPVDAFKRIIDEELKKADAALQAGTPRSGLYEKLLADNAKLFKNAPAPSPAAPAAPAAPVDIKAGNSPAKGPENAKVTIIEFSDFQCPFCSRVNPTISQIMDEYKGKVRVVFKHQPLPFHQDAPLAAEASLAANAQGKFWEFHDKLFANQKAIQRPQLEQYAGELGLDMAKFKAALDQGTYKAAVAADQAEARKYGASGTPTFFINGRKLVGAQPFPAFKALIDEELAK